MSAVKKVKIDADAAKPEDDKIDQRIEAAEKIQLQLDEINNRMTDEIFKVEAKYNKEMRPFYTQRSDLTSKIPYFWLTVFENSDIGNLLTDEDKEILKHLIDVDVVDNGDNKFYKIQFKFEKNNYFENDLLVKEYAIDNNNIPTVTSNKIKWKPGKDVTVPRKSEDKGNKRTLDEIREGFFNWFSSIENDEIGPYIKETIFPVSCGYYRGVELEEIDDDDDDNYGGSEDEAEEADDDK